MQATNNCISEKGNNRNIDSYLMNELRKNNSPSVQYFHFNRNSIIFKFQSGFSDLKIRKPVDEHTSYNVFSVTKTFTALAILQLAERNLMEIDSPVKSYLPSFLSDSITIRQLLTHSAGIANPLPISWIHLLSEHDSFDSRSFFSPILLKNSKLSFKPNDKFSYSNLGYIILGQLIEKISKLNYEEYISEHIINKMNLPACELGFKIENQENHAIGYQNKHNLVNAVLGFYIDKSKMMEKAEGKWKPFHKFYVNGNAYGGLIGTPVGLVKYVQELLTPNSILILDVYKSLLFTENHTNKGIATGMCLSWFKGSLDGNTYFAHAGGGGGYYCEIRVYPDLGTGSVILFNRTGVSDERYLDRVDRFINNKNMATIN